LIALAVFLVGLILFLPLLSINYDLNGIQEAAAVEAGGRTLFDHNHMLYRPTGACVYSLLQTLGWYGGGSLFILQVITAVCASFGLSFAFLAYVQMSQSRLRAVLAAVGMAVSWSYWRFSTDAYYITVALPFVAVAILSFLRVWSAPRKARFYAVVSGVACAFAILFWQANIFLLIVLGIGYLWSYKQPGVVSGKFVLSLVLLTLGNAVLIVGLVYLVIGMTFFAVETPSTLLSWVSTHGGGGLYLWGRWGIDRIPSLAKTSVASVIPVWEGFGLHDLLRGVVNLKKVPAQASLVVWALLLLGCAVSIVQYSRNEHAHKRLLLWLIVSYAVYLPFILWWDPYEPKWFVVPNFFFWGVIAVAWGLPGSRVERSALFVLGLVVLVVGFANLSQTIWPNRTRPNEMLHRAACVSLHMEPQDVLLASDWDWPGYVSYFYHRQVRTLIRGNPEDPEAHIAFIEQLVAESRSVGGRVIMMDMYDYPPDWLTFLEENTGLGLEYFTRLVTTPLFTCDGVQFVIVEGVE